MHPDFRPAFEIAFAHVQGPKLFPKTGPPQSIDCVGMLFWILTRKVSPVGELRKFLLSSLLLWAIPTHAYHCAWRLFKDSILLTFTSNRPILSCSLAMNLTAFLTPCMHYGLQTTNLQLSTRLYSGRTTNVSMPESERSLVKSHDGEQSPRWSLVSRRMNEFLSFPFLKLHSSFITSDIPFEQAIPFTTSLQRSF